MQSWTRTPPSRLQPDGSPRNGTTKLPHLAAPRAARPLPECTTAPRPPWPCACPPPLCWSKPPCPGGVWQSERWPAGSPFSHRPAPPANRQRSKKSVKLQGEADFYHIKVSRTNFLYLQLDNPLPSTSPAICTFQRQSEGHFNSPTHDFRWYKRFVEHA
jgi:hypothetical protein